MTTPTTTVTVNGLTMPTALYPRVMAAVRGLFPAVTGTLSDAGALQAVMLHMATDWLATWESRQAADPVAAAQAAGDAAQQQCTAAATQARTDATAITPTVTT